jgi:hypothetical protein
MNFTEFYSNCMAATNEVADEIESYGGDAERLLDESAYRMAIETYNSVAFEIVDAMRGDGHLFDNAEYQAAQDLDGLEINFWDMVHRIAYHGALQLMHEQAERLGLDV